MKIPQDNIKRRYEFTFLIPAVYTSSELAKILAQLKKRVKKFEGEIIEEDNWGKKPLAYEINKNNKAYDEANYYHWLIEILPQGINLFEKAVLLDDRVIRHLLIKIEADEEDKEE